MEDAMEDEKTGGAGHILSDGLKSVGQRMSGGAV